ncbi:MAG: hypothetical protein WC817_03045 [Patescibacteria group bacterium]|jgi:hypothetical protein
MIEKRGQFNPEVKLPPETESDMASIRLEFFRHDDKESEAGDPSVRLSQRGRVHATEAGLTKNAHAEVALAYGSLKDRTAETALRHALARREEIQPTHSLEDIQRIVDQELNVGKKGKKLIKNRVLPQLNLNNRGTAQYRQQWLQHYKESKDALRFVYHDSDRLAQELNDKKSTSYSRAAGNVAELIQKYIGILPRWQEIVKQNPDKYKRFRDELQRFFCSHHAVLEPFLMKVIERTEGEEGVEKFIESLPNKNGFGLSEGYSVTITGHDGQPTVTLKYGDKEWVIPTEMVNEIVRERDEFNHLIDNKSSV